MTDRYLFWVRISVLASAALFFVTVVCSQWLSGLVSPLNLTVICCLLIVFLACAFSSLRRLQARIHSSVEHQLLLQSEFIAGIPPKWLLPAVALAAATGLLLELIVIRWYGSVFSVFAFYRNFALLACFAGLGCGYALADQKRIPLIFCIPVLVFQQLTLVLLRYALPESWLRSLVAMPVQEQVNVGMNQIPITIPEYISVYTLLAAVLLSTLVAFMPLGQVCGNLMSRATALRAYGANLAGSLAGVVIIFLLSAACTPPAIWFVVGFLGCILLTAYSRRALIVALVSTLIGVCVLDWPVTLGSERIYSPYQLLERGPGIDGLSQLHAAGMYYQRILDLSSGNCRYKPELQKTADYYNIPYKFVSKPPDLVAIFGAGTGNDLAAALRNGAREVDGIEIDPCIVQLGKWYHPEKPWLDPRVHCIVDDARVYLRRSDKHYDMIVFGLLDSHTLSSHASSLRLDSYVYTVDALKEARSHLKEHGLISLSFSTPTAPMVKKIYQMMTAAFDGHPPLCIGGSYDSSFTFLQTKEGDASKLANLIPATGFKDFGLEAANAQGHVDVATDDWPFFYMPARVWPFSYLPMCSLLLLGTWLFYRSLSRVDSAVAVESKQIPAWHHLDFFLLGAGFMLIEAKAITELSLSFGSTWVVTGIVISAIMLMAFLANLLVAVTKITSYRIPYVLLLTSLAGGFYVVSGGTGFQSDTFGKLASIVVLTLPVFFSGMVFSARFRMTSSLPTAMAANLIGALCGGLLEYTSMYLGYRALYVVAFVIYLSAFAISFLQDRKAAGVTDLAAK